MERKFYRLTEPSGLAGLVFEGSESADTVEELVEVVRIIDFTMSVGARNASYVIPEGIMFLARSVMEEVDDPFLREFDALSDHGAFVEEGSLRLGDLVVAYSQHESVLAVSLLEALDDGSTRTVYSQNFYKDFSSVKSRLAALVDSSGGEAADVDDLVFKLRELKAAEGPR